MHGIIFESHHPVTEESESLQKIFVGQPLFHFRVVSLDLFLNSTDWRFFWECQIFNILFWPPYFASSMSNLP